MAQDDTNLTVILSASEESAFVERVLIKFIVREVMHVS